MGCMGIQQNKAERYGIQVQMRNDREKREHGRRGWGVGSGLSVAPQREGDHGQQNYRRFLQIVKIMQNEYRQVGRRNSVC